MRHHIWLQSSLGVAGPDLLAFPNLLAVAERALKAEAILGVLRDGYAKFVITGIKTAEAGSNRFPKLANGTPPLNRIVKSPLSFVIIDKASKRIVQR